MTVFSLHQRERSARRTRLARPLLLVALFALGGQAMLPHLHALQTSSHAARGQALEHPAAAPGQARAALEREATPAGTDHAESRCPVCQTLAHAHDLLPASSQRPALPDARLARVGATRHARAGERIVAHAPRSPPLPA